MKSTRRWLALCTALLMAAAAGRAPAAEAPSSAADATRALSGAQLVQALRAGGYVVYFRHTATDFSQSDSRSKGFDDCANQRLLNAQGRSDARAIGERIRALRLAEGEVLASPMCRTMEHAQLVFGRAQPTPAMREADGGDYPGLRQLLASPVAPASNRWLFGHGTPLRAVAGPPHLREGEAVVLLPDAPSWIVVARIGVADWAQLTARP
jgi:hypothetical protein